MQERLSDANPASAWHWGEYALDPARRRLTQHGEPVEVEDRVFDLLALLLQHRERALDRREVTEAIWGKRPVSDATLRQLVYAARRAVGDDGDHQHTISTLYGRGLQWVAPVEMVFETDDGASAPGQPLPASTELPVVAPAATQPASAMPRRRRWWPAGAALACLLVAAGAWLGVRALHHQGAPAVPAQAPRVAIEPFTNATGDASLDWVGNGLPGLLGGLLNQAGGVDVVDGKQVARALKFKPTQGRNHEQQVRFATDADVLVGGELHKLGADLYQLKLSVMPGAGRAPAEFTLTGAKPGLLAADVVPRIRRALGLAVARAVPDRLPRDAFLAEAYARGRDLVAHGKWSDAREYFNLCAKGAPNFLPALWSLGVAQFSTNDVVGGERTLQRVAERAARQGDVRMQARALEQLGHLARSLDDNARALGYLQQAARLAQREGDALVETSARALLADVLHKLQKPVESRRELQLAEALVDKHPQLVSARALLYDMQGDIAGDEGDLPAAVAAARAALELREALGDEDGVAVSMFNLALQLRASHKDAESLGLSIRCYQRAVAGNDIALQFPCGANAAASLLDFGLPRLAMAMAGRIMPVARQTGSSEYPVLVLQLRSMGEMQQGDFRAALADLRKADASTDVSKLEYATYLDQAIYEALATFVAAPQDMPSFSQRFDAQAAAHLKEEGYLQRRAMLRALASAAEHKAGDALAHLRTAAAAKPLSQDGDVELRMAPLLIAQAGHDKAAAAIALKGYDPATTNDAGILRPYAQWMRQIGDAASAQRAEARLAQLQKQGRDALASGGLDPDHPFGDPIASAPAPAGGE